MDLDERIKPALTMLTGKSLSAAEFQKLLYEYFEERGVLMDLRAHLRTQMINVLRETALGKVIVSKKPEISAKLQALNLLIAEYLLHNNYHYSLSVFSSEVPLGHVFLSDTINTLDNINCDNLKPFKFTDSDLWDILDTLGFNRLAHSAQDLSVLYKSCEQNCLLQSIFHNMSEMNSKKVQSKTEIINNWLQRGSQELQTMDIEGLIAMFKATNVDVEVILKIMEQIRIVMSNEVEKLRKNNREEVERFKRKVQLESSMKLDKYRQKLSKMDLTFKQEKQRLETQLFEAKQSLHEHGLALQEKHREMNDLNENVKRLERRLKTQEAILQQKEQNLQNRQEYLETKEQRIDKHLEDILKLSQKIEINDEGKIGNQQLEGPTKLEQENLILKKSSQMLHEEIANLQGENQTYHRKVHDLVNKTNDLLSQLESKQQNYNFDDPIIPNRPHNSLNSSLPTINTPRTRYSVLPNYDGSGEEGSPNLMTIKQSSPCRGFRNLYTHRKKKNASQASTSGASRKQRTNEEHFNYHQTPTTTANKQTVAMVTSTSSSEDLSPTDAILQEAKTRLEVLERESNEIDKHYEQLSTKSPLKSNEINTAAGLLQTFHTNVAMLKESISKMFFVTPETVNCVDSFQLTENPVVGIEGVKSDNGVINQNEIDLCNENQEEETPIIEKLDDKCDSAVNNEGDKDTENFNNVVASLKTRDILSLDNLMLNYKDSFHDVSVEKYEDCSPLSSVMLNLNGETISTIEISTDDRNQFELE